MVRELEEGRSQATVFEVGLTLNEKKIGTHVLGFKIEV